MVAFAQDGERAWSDRGQKIVIRSLLFCTARKGLIVESMHAVLNHEKKSTIFAFWAHADVAEVRRGGGLFVGFEGVASYHHFCLLSGSQNHVYDAGPQSLEIYATILGEDRARKLAECELVLEPPAIQVLVQKCGSVMFNWSPDERRYVADLKVDQVSYSDLLGDR